MSEASVKTTEEMSEAQVNVKTEKKAKAAYDPEELVEYTAPLAGMEKRRDILVAVNGETIRIKRGRTVKIKRKFKEALDNAARQEYAAYMAAADAAKQGAKATAEL